MEPVLGFEPRTDGLQNRCSTTQLNWLLGREKREARSIQGPPAIGVIMLTRALPDATLRHTCASHRAGPYRRSRRPHCSGVPSWNLFIGLMPILLALLALLLPRVTILILWLLTPWFEGIFATALWPVLGFLLLPTTLLWYSAVAHWFGGQWDLIPLIGLVAAILLDLSPTGLRRRRVEPAV